MKRLILILVAALCTTATATPTTYTFTPQAQKLIDKELGELMIRLYLTPEHAYLRSTDIEDYKELIIVVPAHEWKRMNRATNGTWWQSACTVVWPTLRNSFYGVLIGIASSSTILICCGALGFIIQPHVGCCCLCCIAIPIVVGVTLGVIIGGITGFVHGLISGVRKLLCRKKFVERVTSSLPREPMRVAVRFPSLSEQLKQLVADNAALYIQLPVGEPGLIVID